MSKVRLKTKLTVIISKDVLDKAKKVAEEKGLPISHVIERFLDFFADPYVYCFKCGKKFRSSEAGECPKCGWMICPYCKACRCSLTNEEAAVAYFMRKVYEELVAGRVK
mgnify:CR=1 FL=1